MSGVDVEIDLSNDQIRAIRPKAFEARRGSLFLQVGAMGTSATLLRTL
jgi:hypothetical protein